LSLNQSLDLNDYVERLRRDPAELNSLYKDLLIGVTRFFRDSDAFAALARQVIPEILTDRKLDDEVRVWVAGCATGEEAYSLAILFHEQMQALGKSWPIKIFAADVHRASLETASAAVYSADSLAGMSPERIERYFVRKPDGYHVVSELRKMIVFARHNVIRDAPFTKLDLISCRNLLIYFQPAAQKRVLSLFHFALRTGGILFLGPSETTGELGGELQTIDEHWKLYRKRRDVRLPGHLRMPMSLPSEVRVAPPQPQSVEAPLLAAYDRLLEECMPPGLLLDHRRQLVHAFGGAGRFLRHPDGRPTTDILDLLDHELKLALAGALQRAAKEQTPVSYTGVRVRTSRGEEVLKLSVRPILNRHGNLTHLFVSLESLSDDDARPHQPREMHAGEASREHVDSLETELRYTRENLQATIEELETANEELQASNEELVASNEELQSTNEELHSVNEELYTVNAEYQKKIAELTELTDDMDNLLRSTDVGTIFLDRQLCIRKFTPQIGKAFDLLPQDIGRRIDSFSHSIRHPNLVEDLAQVLETDTPIEKEVQDRAGNWFFLRMLPYRSHAMLDGVVLTLIDVSALKRTEAHVAQLSAIVESSDDAIISTDLSGKIMTWNEGAEHLYGYQAEEAVGQHISILRPASPMEKHARDWPLDMVDRIRAGQAADRHLEIARRHRDGHELEVLMTFSPIWNVQHELVGISSIARDITQRKRAEQAIRRSAEELATANQELRENVERRKVAEQRARDALQRRDQFLAMLSHELRNPLAALVNASSLLGREDVGPEFHRQAAAAIQRQSRHMARLLDDLLDVTRLTRNQIEIRRRVLDLRETARDAVESVKPFVNSRKLRFEVDLPAEPLFVDGDPARLLQIQTNLLNNAAKYTPREGCVWFQLKAKDGQAVITVSDNGLGIPPEMQERVFELFVQLEERPGTRVDGGMGVGLTLVRSLVQLHGGSIEVHSDGESLGSQFTVRLPLADPPRQEDTPAPKATDGKLDLNVLLVEDMADIRELTRKLLEILGCRVAVAANGKEAIATLREESPDVALVDIGLPDIDGYEVARQARKEKKLDGVRLIAVTGFGQNEDRKRAIDAGFDAHLVKPIDLNELTSVLKNGVRRNGRAE
jgi:two-component system CheB/CheR fusion protein